MGVPKFYRWLSERYACLSQVVKDYQVRLLLCCSAVVILKLFLVLVVGMLSIVSCLCELLSRN